MYCRFFCNSDLNYIVYIDRNYMYKAQQNTNLNTIVFKLHLDLDTSLHGARAMR